MEQITGYIPHLKRLHIDQLQRLSLHLRKSYQLYELKLFEKDFVLVYSIAEEPLNPTQAKKVLQVFHTKLQQQMVLVLDQLPTYLKSRYMAQQIPFMVPGQQLFIPQMLMDLNNSKEQLRQVRSYFRPATQCMILYHLLSESINGFSQDTIAEKLNYSAMTISRALKECRNKHLMASKTGVHFISETIELWNQCKTYVESPIKKVVFTDDLGDFDFEYKSGLTALAYYTDLASKDDLSIAITQKEYKGLEKQEVRLDDRYGKIKIEIWEYDPALLSKSQYVDRLSLYLSLHNDNNDARTSKALDSLINQVYD